MSNVITRFAPSPTGFLHIGGARTALFNFLYSRKYGGKFLLRIEDTDRKRSTQKAIDAIISGLIWLEINYDGEVVYQSKRVTRHIEIANLLIKKGKAYYCYCSENEIEKEKILTKNEGKLYKHKCVMNSAQNINPVVRFKIEDSQEIILNDQIYGEIKINSSQFDDIIILRSDNTPTYIFAVVVDDHDAEITHIIRGSDHLTNTFKQLLIYQALDFDIPTFAHVPLIHGEDGNKLSKRHGATSVYDYKKMGILPQAMRNYLLRLGWSHGNDEIISHDQAVEWFNLHSIGRSPAQLDSKKLEHLNNYYISNTSNEDILSILTEDLDLSDIKKHYLLHGLTELKKRANYLTELPELGKFYIEDIPFQLSEETLTIIKCNINTINLLTLYLSNIEWNKNSLSTHIKEFSKLYDIKISNVYHSLRVPITGMINASGIIDIMLILDKEECIKRLKYSKNYI
ncbi:MAG: glutamate--tRNA ligase [Wolbachia endosymbiont of Fragariocoptes setiger]|nr:glutamate--tRNA ligase [Wolbachia endosymbiont of Fragariocoptes setiger]